MNGTRLAYKVFFIACTLALCQFAGAQSTITDTTKVISDTAGIPDLKLTAVDGEFIMELSRDGKPVKVMLYFKNPKNYSYIIIEKALVVSQVQFRQCSYVDMKEIDGDVVELKDNYPYSNSEDSYYRVKAVTLENIERIYPAVRLPAIIQSSTR